MRIGLFGHHTSPRRTIDKADLQKIRLIDIFQGHALLTDGTGDGLQSDRSALEAFDDPFDVFVIHAVQTEVIDLQTVQRLAGDLLGNDAFIEHLGKVAHPSKQAVGNARGAAGTQGDLMHGFPVDVHTGGSVANTGLAMKILGADVTLMGKIGKDAFGDMIHNILKEYKAEKGMLVMEGESTSYSVILAVPGIDRIFLHNPGANDTFQADDVPQKELENASLFHFGYPPLMKKMYEHHGEELQKLMIKVKDTGAATSLDMAAVDSAADVGHIDWKQILEKVIPYVEFMPSAEELCYMLDKERFADWQKRAGSQDITEILDIEKDIKPLAKQCMDFGAKVLLIKCGTPGISIELQAGIHL